MWYVRVKDRLQAGHHATYEDAIRSIEGQGLTPDIADVVFVPARGEDPVTEQEIGKFIDAIIDKDNEGKVSWCKTKQRNARTEALRVVEEATELALEVGVDPKDILVRVTDQIHKEAKKIDLKPSSNRFGIVKGMEVDREQHVKAVGGEVGDVALTLLDFCYVYGVELNTCARQKFEEIKPMEFKPNIDGTVSTVKVKPNETETPQS